MADNYSTTIRINAETARVWTVITDPGLMSQWMGDVEMTIQVRTSWQLNSPILISGFHHTQFEIKGMVLKFQEPKVLSYTHLSSLSMLADEPKNYTKLEFILNTEKDHTVLTVNLENFPTVIIKNHLEFYWRGTLPVIKQLAENPG